MTDAQLTPILSTVQLIAQARTAQRQSRPLEAIDLCRQILAIAELSEDQRNATYLVLIEALDDTFQFDEVLIQANYWAESAQSPIGRVGALLAQSGALRRKGNLAEALQIAEEASALAESHDYAQGRATADRRRAELLWLRGESEAALELLRRTLILYETLRDVDGQLQTLMSIGVTYHLMGRFYDAIMTGLRTASLCEASGDLSTLWLAYNNLGEAYQNLYAMDKALLYHQKAQAIMHMPTADVIRNLGVDLVALGKVDEGLELLRDALARARASAEKDVLLQTLNSLGSALLTVGNIGEAHTLGQELLSEARAIDARQHVTRATLLLGRCALAAGDPVSAQAYLQESFTLAQRTGDKSIIWQTHAVLADMLADSQPALAKVHHMIASDMLNNIVLSVGDRELRDTFRKAPLVARWLQPGDYDDE